MVKCFLKMLDKLPFKGVYCYQKEKVFYQTVENGRIFTALIISIMDPSYFVLNKSGGSVMKYYDARVIENCCVFSYEVKTPDRSSNKGDKRKKASVM